MLTIPQPFGRLVIPRAKGAPDAEIAFTDSRATDANLTTYTFENVGFGAEASNRYLILGVTAFGTSSRTLSSASIGGVSASVVVDYPNFFSSAGVNVAIMIAAVPTGTSGTVSVTWSGAHGACGVSIHRVVNLLSTTPVSTDTDVDAATMSGTLNVPAGGIAIGVGFGGSGHSWGSGVTEGHEDLLQSPMVMSSAAGQFASENSSYGIEVTVGSATWRQAAFASLR